MEFFTHRVYFVQHQQKPSAHVSPEQPSRPNRLQFQLNKIKFFSEINWQKTSRSFHFVFLFLKGNWHTHKMLQISITWLIEHADLSLGFIWFLKYTLHINSFKTCELCPYSFIIFMSVIFLIVWSFATQYGGCFMYLSALKH